MNAPTKRDCAGCKDDFYNHRTNMDGKQECWSQSSATFVQARDIPIGLRPPYKHIPLTMKPSCYKAQGYVRVKPEGLTAEGFWK